MNHKRRRPWVSCVVVIIISTLILYLIQHIAFKSCEIIIIPGLSDEDLPSDCLQTHFSNLVVTAKENISCKLISNQTYDLRIIVLTYNRPSSLLEILHSLTSLEMDGDSVLLEIWIDKSKEGKVDRKTFNHATSFRWKQGPVHVYVQERHTGIIGQWLFSWRPKLKTYYNQSTLSRKKDSPSSDDYEIGLILEDDLTLSPYAYRWLKSARRHFGKENNLAGITLQSEGLIVAENGRPFDPNPLLTGPSYLYKLIGSWGFAPDPKNWVKFQDWFRHKGEVRPYVPNILMTRWYKNFEKKKISDTMWTMWYIYFCHLNDLYTVYSNLVKNDQFYKLPLKITATENKSTPITTAKSKSTTRACLVLNRREPGLHFKAKVTLNQSCVNWDWRPEYVQFKKDQVRYGYKGVPMKVI